MAIAVDKSTVFTSTKSFGGSALRNVSAFKIDFTVAANQLAQNEIMRICTVPAGTMVTSCVLYVHTADADVTDVDLGVTTATTTSANLFDGLSLAATGYIAGNVDLSAAGGGVQTTAASNILLTNKDANTIDEAVITVIIETLDLPSSLT